MTGLVVVDYLFVKDGQKLRFGVVPDDILTEVVEIYLKSGYTFIREVTDYDAKTTNTYAGKHIRPDEPVGDCA